MPMQKKPRTLCACGCGREPAQATYKFFSVKCQGNFEYRDYIDRWKAGLESGSIGSMGQISNHIKRYLFEKYNNACSECGWAKRHILTGKAPLEVDHINGDANDNRESNLRLLCPSCHSLTGNFRALNWGKGRVNRK